MFLLSEYFRKTFNGHILETTVDFYLYFTGRYDEKLVPAIFNAIVKNRDKSAKPSHKGKGVVSIGGLYFYQFDIMSITVWVNTHEIEGDDERFDRRSCKYIFELLLYTIKRREFKDIEKGNTITRGQLQTISRRQTCNTMTRQKTSTTVLKKLHRKTITKTKRESQRHSKPGVNQDAPKGLAVTVLLNKFRIS